MKKSKRASAGARVGAAAALLILAAAWLLPGGGEARVADFVEANGAELETIALDWLRGAEGAPERYRGAAVEGVYPGEQPIVQFSYLGGAIIPSAPYCGFYYAPDDAPVPFQNCGLPLTEGEEREWTWTDGADNRGVTRRIAPRWFYYEAWF